MTTRGAYLKRYTDDEEELVHWIGLVVLANQFCWTASAGEIDSRCFEIVPSTKNKQPPARAKVGLAHNLTILCCEAVVIGLCIVKIRSIYRGQ